MDFDQVLFSGHAIRRMFARAIGKDDVLSVIRKGRVIDEYPDDNPYPSVLILGYARNLPMHVVLGIDKSARRGIIITAYIPDPKIWHDDYKTRRRP